MYSILVSVAAGLAIGVVVALGFNLGAGVFTGFFVALVVFFLLLRRGMEKMQSIQTDAMKHLESLQSHPHRQKQALDLAIHTLEDGLKYKHWVLLGEAQINANIGYIYYLRKDFGKAFPYLEGAFVRHWMAQAMLAACHYRKKEYDKVREVMERAVKYNKKVPFLWACYAWFENSRGEKDYAMDVLQRGVEINSDDENLKSMLLNLKNQKKLKMSKFAELWYQLLLEMPPQRMLQGMQPKFSAYRRRGG